MSKLQIIIFLHVQYYMRVEGKSPWQF